MGAPGPWPPRAGRFGLWPGRLSLWALARLHPENQSLVRKVVERLAQGLTSEDPRHRTAAARALIDLDPDPEIARPIVSRVMEDAAPDVLDAAMDAMASLGERAVPRMIRALGFKEVRARAASVIADAPQQKAKFLLVVVGEALLDFLSGLAEGRVVPVSEASGHHFGIIVADPDEVVGREGAVVLVRPAEEI